LSFADYKRAILALNQGHQQDHFESVVADHHWVQKAYMDVHLIVMGNLGDGAALAGVVKLAIDAVGFEKGG
jgi:hypothetical protein